MQSMLAQAPQDELDSEELRSLLIQANASGDAQLQTQVNQRVMQLLYNLRSQQSAKEQY